MGDQRHLIEVGFYAGGFFPTTEHELYELTIGHQPFGTIALSVGGRLAYLPLPFVALELEGGVVPTRTVGGDDALVYGFRGHLLAQYPARIAPFLLLGGGILGVASGSGAVGHDVDGSYHIGWGVKWYPWHWIAVRLDGRHHVSGELGPGGRGSHYELLVGAAYVQGWRKRRPPRKAAAPPKDTDRDGLVDPKDKCPKKYAKTKDGCPPKDTDGDGLIDPKDKCPTKYAKTPDGCPRRDTDGDGLFDDEDRCPLEYAKTPDGCPDADGDGYPDHKDKCPHLPENFNGYEDEDGCPEELPRPVKRFTGVIRGIYFATGTAKIRRRSFRILDRAAKVLRAYPQVRVTIRGHTDSRGSEAYNLELSRRRAAAVKYHLGRKGIAPERLHVEGVGFAEPMASNRSRRGRALNRRIEFKLGKPTPTTAPASRPAPRSTDASAPKRPPE